MLISRMKHSARLQVDVKSRSPRTTSHEESRSKTIAHINDSYHVYIIATIESLGINTKSSKHPQNHSSHPLKNNIPSPSTSKPQPHLPPTPSLPFSLLPSQSLHQTKVPHLHPVPLSFSPLGPNGLAHIQKLLPWLLPFFFVCMDLQGSSWPSHRGAMGLVKRLPHAR